MAYKIRQAAGAVSTGGSLISDAKLKQLYSTMLQCRLVTERMRHLHSRNGNAAIYQASLGQEAIATGSAIDLRRDDTITSHDSISSLVIAGLVKRAPLDAIVAGLCAHPLTNSTAELQLNAASSVALTNKREKNTRAVITFTGKAMTALPAWHKTLTFCAAHSLPIIFVVENNRGALSQPPISDGEDFALKAQSYGLPGITVDGNDVVAVYRVAHESVERVRQGDGPVLVEARTYYQSDQPGLSQHDPLDHMERYLAAKKLFHARWKNRLVEKFSLELDEATKIPKKSMRR